MRGEYRQFFGKYRGKVSNNIDPMQLGRIQVTVPEVLGDGRMSWALPCVPFAGPGVGFFARPPVGANVWVEFEGGDADFPIWSGCFWGRRTPDSPTPPELLGLKSGAVLKTTAVTLQLSDIPGGGLTLEVGQPVVAVPLKMNFTSAGIEISNGDSSIKMTAVKVNINGNALEVL